MSQLTSADAVNRARDILNDAGVVRWPNSVLRRFLNDFLNRLWTARADAHWNQDGTYATYGQPTISGESVPTDSLWPDARWDEAAGLFIAASALEMDGADQMDAAKASRLWQRFTLLMQEHV